MRYLVFGMDVTVLYVNKGWATFYTLPVSLIESRPGRVCPLIEPATVTGQDFPVLLTLFQLVLQIFLYECYCAIVNN